MKNTIKEELETKYLKEELVNDNTLLLYEQVSEDDIVVKMRYIESNRLKESTITHLTKEEFVEGNRIRFNENNTALLVYKKHNDEDVIKSMVDLETHYKICPDYLYIAYEKKFNSKIKHYKK